MGFKQYHSKLILFIVLLVATSFAMGWAWFSSRIHMAIMLTMLVLLEAIILLIQLSRANKEILFFFRALENDDTSFRYTSDFRGKFIDELHQYLNKLNNSFREMKVSNELREQYFAEILENLSSGLMVIAKTGHINHINNEALRLFNIPGLTHVDALSRIDEKLCSKVMALKSLEKFEITLPEKDIGIKKVLGLQAVEVNLQGEDVRIITVQDLSVEMERKEIDDWIRLIRVMSHEIMNTLAPITSISTTLKVLWTEQGKEHLEASDPKIRQTLKGLDAIAEQSDGLTTFFESYRMLSRIPDPQKREFSVCCMFERLETLVIHNPENAGISITFTCENPDLVLHADEQMITQAMLNLIKNSTQALDGIDHPEILIQANPDPGKGVKLSVTDNGPGITSEIADEIFMPFFTTREKGTGVGLSYSRQVMNMNNGKIEFDSIPGQTEFRLLFI